jgi:hypothetical protein
LEEIRDYRLLTLIVNALVAGGLTPSLTRTVKPYGEVVDAPDAGVPVNTPEFDNDKSGGRGGLESGVHV